MSKKLLHEPYNALKLALAGKGLTYDDVAAVIDKTRGSVQTKISGQSDFYISEQEVICNKWGIKKADFK